MSTFLRSALYSYGMTLRSKNPLPQIYYTWIHICQILILEYLGEKETIQAVTLIFPERHGGIIDCCKGHAISCCLVDGKEHIPRIVCPTGFTGDAICVEPALERLRKRSPHFISLKDEFSICRSISAVTIVNVYCWTWWKSVGGFIVPTPG